MLKFNIERMQVLFYFSFKPFFIFIPFNKFIQSVFIYDFINHKKYFIQIIRFINLIILNRFNYLFLISRLNLFEKRVTFNFFYHFFKRFKNLFHTQKSYKLKFYVKGLGFNVGKLGEFFLKIKLNLSFDLILFIPKFVSFQLFNNVVFISSNYKKKVESVAEFINKLKKPSVYKNVGIFHQHLS